MARGATYLTSQHDSDLDARIEEYRRRRERDFSEAWSGPNSWTSRFDAGCFVLSPVMARLAGAGKARVLEIGCGQGQKVLSYAPFVGSVLGIDLDGDHISFAKNAAWKMNSPNVAFDQVEANDVRKILDKDRFDIIVVYAVMEHLTPIERLDLLSNIWSSLDDHGLIIMGETPNRIASCDMHSSFLPFVDSLIDEYYLQYVDRFTPRDDWRPYVGRYEDRILGSFRAGRGVSFHEFDLHFGKAGEAGNFIVGDSFGALTRNMYPLRRSEIALMDEFRWQGNNIDQFFSRYWLEGIISKNPSPQNRTQREFSLVSPSLPFDVARGFDLNGLRVYGLKSKEQAVTFDLPPSAHAYQLLFDVRSRAGRAEIVDQHGEMLEVINIAELASIVFPGGSYAAIDRTVAPGTTAITVRPEADSVVVTGDLGVFGVGSLGPLDERTPKILDNGNF